MRSIFFLLVLVPLIISSCGGYKQTSSLYGGSKLKAECVDYFETEVKFCKTRLPLSNKVQDGSLIEIVSPSGKVLKVAAYYDSRYGLCLPYTYHRLLKEGEKVKVFTLRCGYKYNPTTCPYSEKVGYASWYGYGDGSGKWTASSRPFKPETNGLASRDLPFGTLVKITNLDNGRTTYAVVLDRGPFVKGRDWDLYPKTMRDLGGIKKGVIPVKVQIVRCGWPVEEDN